MKLLKKNYVYLSGLILSLFIIFFIYKTINKKTITPPIKNKTNIIIDGKTKPAFHASDIKKIQFKIMEKTYDFKKNNLGHWPNQAIQHKIIEQLNNISMMHIQTINNQNKTLFSLKFNLNNNLWVGNWDGDSFLWTKGPLKGYGAFLKQSPVNKIFQEGRYTFSKTTKNWCTSLIESIHFIDEEENSSVIYSNKAHWYRKNTNNEIHKFDGTYLQKWIGRFCNFKAKLHVDLETINTDDLLWTDMLIQFKNKTYQNFRLELSKGYVGFVINEKETEIFIQKDFVNSLKPFLDPSIKHK